VPKTVFFAEAGHHGGSVNRLWLLLRDLDRRAVRPIVLSHFQDGTAAKLLAGPGDEPRFTLGLTRDPPPEPLSTRGPLVLPTPFGFRYFFRALRILRAHRPGLAYLNNSPFSHLPLVVACRLMKVAYVCHMRDMVRLTRSELWALGHAERVVVLSRSAQSFYAAQGLSPARLLTIYDGISLQNFDRDRGGEAQAPDGALVVALTGSLVRRKRPGDALELARRLAPRFPGLLLVLFGDGPERGRLEAEIAAQGLAKNVRIHGWTDQVPRHLARCHVALMVSEREGMPNSVLEYMAAALPVVATDLPGVREMVEDGASGFVVRAGDLDALEARLGTLLEDPGLRRRMGARGRQILESGRFSLAAEHEAVLRLLRDEPSGEAR
jgi:glycosyltransferase involved in cell wall biosynthesis